MYLLTVFVSMGVMVVAKNGLDGEEVTKKRVRVSHVFSKRNGQLKCGRGSSPCHIINISRVCLRLRWDHIARL